MTKQAGKGSLHRKCQVPLKVRDKRFDSINWPSRKKKGEKK